MNDTGVLFTPEHYGASPDDWFHWDVGLGLTEDLLPVVCSPNERIAVTSTLTGYGKVPSRFDVHGHVVGFPKWTQHRASDADLRVWSADDRLGICLQTRLVRAIDVDIEDWDSSLAARETFDAWRISESLPPFPIRSRSNSCKWLALFFLSGEHAKQVLRTPDGDIELLLNGQQCLIAGRHTSGSRYDWDGVLPTAIPVITLEQFKSLKASLRTLGSQDWSEGRARKHRDAGVSEHLHDPVVDFLQTHGWVRR